MSRRIIPCQVTDEYVRGSGVVVGAAGSHNDVALRLVFGPMWAGTARSIVWKDALGGNPTVTILGTDLLETGETEVYIVPIPAKPKAYAGDLSMTIKGAVVEGDKETSATLTARAFFTVMESDWDEGAAESGDITPSQAEQFQAQLEAIKSDIAASTQAAADAAASAEAAAASETAAGQHAESAGNSASLAALSAQGAAGSATEANDSRLAAALSAVNAGEAQTAAENAATQAEASNQAAAQSQSAAAASEKNAAKSEQNVAQNTQNAAQSAQAAAASAEAAAQSETAAEQHADNADNSASLAALSAQGAAGSATEANDSRLAAALSAVNAGEAQTAAENAATQAEASNQAAAQSQSAAATSEKNAAKSVQAASQSAAEAAQSANTAGQSSISAASSAAAAEACKDAAAASQQAAAQSETQAEYWAKHAEAAAGGDFATKIEAQGYASSAKQAAIDAAAADATEKASAAEQAAKNYADQNISVHTSDKSNPHGVTKAQLGLGEVDNTSDKDKPVSTNQAAAIADAKKAGTDAQTALSTHDSNTTKHITAAERTAWNGKAEGTHSHDDRYYTETEVDNKIAKKADLDESGKVPSAQLPEISSVKTYTAAIGTTWTVNEDTGVKYQSVAISGILSTHTAKVDHAYTGDGTSDGYAAFVEAENQYLTYITNGYAETYDGGVKFYIFGDANTVEIPIVVEVA